MKIEHHGRGILDEPTEAARRHLAEWRLDRIRKRAATMPIPAVSVDRDALLREFDSLSSLREEANGIWNKAHP